MNRLHFRASLSWCWRAASAFIAAMTTCEVDHTAPARDRVQHCPEAAMSGRFRSGVQEMSNQWKANLLTVLIVAALVLAYAHSYGYL